MMLLCGKKLFPHKFTFISECLHVKGEKPKHHLVWNKHKNSETDLKVWWITEASMWLSPRGSPQYCSDVFSLLIHLKGDKKPTNPSSSSCEIYNSSPSKCHIWLPDSSEQHYGNRDQLPNIKEPCFLVC